LEEEEENHNLEEDQALEGNLALEENQVLVENHSLTTTEDEIYIYTFDKNFTNKNSKIKTIINIIADFHISNIIA
jgi:hypothetical protein